MSTSVSVASGGYLPRCFMAQKMPAMPLATSTLVNNNYYSLKWRWLVV